MGIHGINDSTSTALQVAAPQDFGSADVGLIPKDQTTMGYHRHMNPAAYHNARHPIYVAKVVSALNRGMESPVQGDKNAAKIHDPEKRDRFLRQVALIHDADDRVGAKNPVIKARVLRTLELMDEKKNALMKKFAWNERDFHIAKCLVMRTEFPFNDNQPDPKTGKLPFPEGDWLNYKGGYTGSGPVQKYEEMLKDPILSREDQAAVLHNGLKLTYSDTDSFYLTDPKSGAAMNAILGLAKELQNAGVPITENGLLKGTPDFLQGIIENIDTRHDVEIARRLGFNEQEIARILPTGKQLFSSLPEMLQNNFRTNKQTFVTRRDQIVADEQQAKA